MTIDVQISMWSRKFFCGVCESRWKRSGKKLRTSSWKLFVGRAVENGQAWGWPLCQGVSLQGRGRQKDRPRDFPCPLGFVFYSLSFSFYSPAVFILPCLSTGAGHGPNESRIIAARYQLVITTRCHCAVSLCKTTCPLQTRAQYAPFSGSSDAFSSWGSQQNI